MKYVLWFAAGLSLLAGAALPASAGIVGHASGPDGYVLPKDSTIFDNFYVAAGSIVSAGDVAGDLWAAGGNISVSGDVADDAALVSGRADISGRIGGDARVAAGEVALSGTVGGDFVATGGSVTVSPDAVIGSDAIVLGSDVTLAGSYSGSVKVVAARVRIVGDVAEDVRVIANEVTIGSGARIAGDLVWSGEKAPVLEPGATVLGSTIPGTFAYFDGSKKEVPSKEPFLSPGFMVKLCVVLLLALFITWVFPGAAERFSEAVSAPRRFGLAALTGLAVFAAMPLVSGILLITILGAALGILGLLTYASLLTIASAISGIIFGEWLYRLIRRNGGREKTWKIILVGVVLLALVGKIPFVGPLASALFFLVALGELSVIILSALKAIRHPSSSPVPPVSSQ